MSKNNVNIDEDIGKVRRYDEELEAATYRKAFSILAQEEYEQIAAMPEDEEERRSFERMDEDIVRTISHGLRKNKRNTWRHRIQRTVNVAASVIVMFSIALGVAMATPAFRQQLYRLSTKLSDGYTRIALAPNDNFYIDVPDEWQGEYYPSYVPDGYELYHVSQGSLLEATYMRGQDYYFTFCEYDENTVTALDTENAKVSYGEVHDCEAMIVEKNGLTTVTWTEADKLFIVEVNENVETALNIARNIGTIQYASEVSQKK